MGLKEGIKFSVIMPAYNAENYIGYAIESVLSQTYSNFELIIVNDGSIDKTESIVKQYSDRDQRVILVSQENSGSAGAARNTALKYVTGDYIQMLDADDYFESNMLESYIKKLEERDYDIMLPDCFFVNEEGIFISSILPVDKNYSTVLSNEEAFVLSLNWTIHGCMCIRASILRKIGYDVDWMNSDELTTRKAFLSAKSISFAPTKYYYRQHPNSTTKSEINNVKFFQSLMTDYELYRIVCNKRMGSKVRRMISAKYLNNFFYLQNRYNESENSYTEIEKKEIQNIMAQAFKKFNIRFCIDILSKKTVLLLSCCGVYPLFQGIYKIIKILGII